LVGAADQKRQHMKQLISELAKENPQLRRSLIGALGNVQPRHLMDPRLTPFAPLGKESDMV
jgi:tRNA 2-thiocytidine biosynthesis protein TtcA